MKTLPNTIKEEVNMKGLWRFTVREGNSGKVKSQTEYLENLIVTVGKTQLAKAISGNIGAVTDIKIQYQALGDDNTAPNAGDTILSNETVRKFISSLGYSGGQTNVTAFFAVGEATGTHLEFGVFMAGTIAPNSGVMMNHILINVTVGAGDSLTVDGTITFT